MGALALSAALVLYAALHAGRFAEVVVAIGAVGAIVLALALATRFAPPVAWAVAVLGTAYAVALVLRGGTIDAAAPAVAVGLLLVAELAYWSIERAVPTEAGLLGRRAGHVLIAALAGSGAAALALAVSEVATGGGLAVEALGVAAAGAVLALVAALARRRA